ncbi:MAG: alpha/beta fold hydrolase [Xanthobacteraceae bacterium]|nr:alpha/beta fold hydrolase [Xanthobacteraceae bacterium]
MSDIGKSEKSLQPARRKPWLAVVGVALILAGCLLAWLIQTAGGVRVADIRFAGTNGLTMSALLYIPPNATPQTPAPGILAVHGYMNSRETQSAFAIELARRGYVVLAIDQPGHGYSAPPARANGFGGPDALNYLRSLPFVDKNNIGLEGHSMGGWSVLAAANAASNDYKAIVLNGSSTGRPFAPEGTPTWPRNLALVYGRYDEFAPFFWRSPDARKVTASKKLRDVFGQSAELVPGQVYGSIEQGTARMLFTPSETHPQNHISRETVGHSIDWFQRTLAGGKPLPASDQIWLWKEIGTLVAFIGLVILLLGIFDVWLGTSWFVRLAQAPPIGDAKTDTTRRWLVFAAVTLVPAVTFFPLLALADSYLPASRFLPQAVTNQFVVWALGNTLIGLVLASFLRKRKPQFHIQIGPAVSIALLTVAAGYASLLIADALFKVDFRYWIFALKLMSAAQFIAFLIYLIPFTAFCLVACRGLHAIFPEANQSAVRMYIVNALTLSLGMGLLVAIEYGVLFTTGGLYLPTGKPIEALGTILAIQFVPLLAIIAVISTFTYRRTNSYVPGALISGMFITWYIVAGQATHV